MVDELLFEILGTDENDSDDFGWIIKVLKKYKENNKQSRIESNDAFFDRVKKLR